MNIYEKARFEYLKSKFRFCLIVTGLDFWTKENRAEHKALFDKWLSLPSEY